MLIWCQEFFSLLEISFYSSPWWNVRDQPKTKLIVDGAFSNKNSYPCFLFLLSLVLIGFRNIILSRVSLQLCHALCVSTVGFSIIIFITVLKKVYLLKWYFCFIHWWTLTMQETETSLRHRKMCFSTVFFLRLSPQWLQVNTTIMLILLFAREDTGSSSKTRSNPSSNTTNRRKPASSPRKYSRKHLLKIITRSLSVQLSQLL